MSELTEVYHPEPFDASARTGSWKGTPDKTPDEIQRAVQRHLLALGELVEQAGGKGLVLTDEFLYRLFRDRGAPVLQVSHDARTCTLQLTVHGHREQTIVGEVIEV